MSRDPARGDVGRIQRVLAILDRPVPPSPATTIHYLLVFVAALCVEPPLRGRPLPVRGLLARLGLMTSGRAA